MDNKLEIFDNTEFGKIRTIDIDGKIYFVGRDIATALKYAIPHKAINTHCKEVLKWNTLTNGGNQTMLIIPESDVYRLVTHSKLPSAQKFEKWIFEEVLPTIRKTGSYTLPKQQSLEPLYTPAVRTYQGQRVVTIKDISLATKQPEGSIAYWINTKCKKAADFLLLRGAALQTFKSENGLQGYLASRLYVVFESGFRKICKMLGILPEKTGCFPAPVLDKQLQNFKWKRELRTDVPDNKEIQMILRAIRKRIAAFDIMLEEFDRYNVNTYQEKVKTVLQRIATRICTDTFELTDKHYELVEKAI